MNNNKVVGIDIGGSHITAAIVDLEAHTIIRGSLIRRSVNAKNTAEQIIKEWSNAIVSCKTFDATTCDKIGIAMPGPFDYDKGISLITGLDKFETLYKLNIKELLAKELDITPADIFMMNDANCFLKGEVFGGAATGCNNVIGITLGTGLGSAIYKEAKVIDGDLYYAPYKDATAEDYLSARWFLKRYHELTGITAKDVKEIREQDIETAILLFSEFGDNLGHVLSAFSKKHQISTIVIGGNLVKAWDLFIAETEKVFASNAQNVTIVKATLGEEAALMGAGSLCL